MDIKTWIVNHKRAVVVTMVVVGVALGIGIAYAATVNETPLLVDENPETVPFEVES